MIQDTPPPQDPNRICRVPLPCEATYPQFQGLGHGHLWGPLSLPCNLTKPGLFLLLTVQSLGAESPRYSVLSLGPITRIYVQKMFVDETHDGTDSQDLLWETEVGGGGEALTHSFPQRLGYRPAWCLRLGWSRPAGDSWQCPETFWFPEMLLNTLQHMWALTTYAAPTVYSAKAGKSLFTPGPSGWKTQEAAVCWTCMRYLRCHMSSFSTGGVYPTPICR